jgi:hypothetical protein
MKTGDFYEDDEPIEKVRSDWRKGERGVTTGPRDLNTRAKAAVDAVVARWDRDESVDGEVTDYGNVINVVFRSEKHDTIEAANGGVHGRKAVAH